METTWSVWFASEVWLMLVPWLCLTVRVVSSCWVQIIAGIRRTHAHLPSELLGPALGRGRGPLIMAVGASGEQPSNPWFWCLAGTVHCPPVQPSNMPMSQTISVTLACTTYDCCESAGIRCRRGAAEMQCEPASQALNQLCSVQYLLCFVMFYFPISCGGSTPCTRSCRSVCLLFLSAMTCSRQCG
ncbi:hypothetical protein BKA65DRAFT_188900 [Rhexocercosporidium sp. MPI-PUGE-AT-0058]|nr:hypothetical protein BKA65DRAFT_188900 [Rhexocercosporidium sp. MPI-PUGE-AT-0058]